MTLLRALDRHEGGGNGANDAAAAAERGELLGFMLRALVPSAVTRAVVREDVLDADVGRAQAEVYAGLWREVRGWVGGCLRVGVGRWLVGWLG